MQSALTIFQIIISIGLIITILLQQRGAGTSGLFGGGGGSGSYHTKRGLEKVLFISSIVLATLFIITAFLSLII